jgi:hypothetical protein
MSDLVKLRKYVATIEETHHDGGPVLAHAVTKAVVGGVIANPYAGRHVADIQPMMKALEPLAVDLTERVMKLLGAKGSDLEAYGKGVQRWQRQVDRAVDGQGGSCRYAHRHSPASCDGGLCAQPFRCD